MRVFVTGATGFVGPAIVELLGAGHQVLGLARSKAAARMLIAAGAQVQRGDVQDLNSLRQGAAAAERVVHTAFNHDFPAFKSSSEADRRAIEALGSALVGSDRLLLVVTSASGLVAAPGRLALAADAPTARRNSRVATEEAAAQLTCEGAEVGFVELNLLQPATLSAAVAYIQREVGHLDILVNNAGINVPGDGPLSWAEVSSVEQALLTNFAGALAVIRASLPLARQAAAGRIVSVSSPLSLLHGQQARNLLGYSASKAALNMRTVQLAYELRHTTIKVNSANPGYTATDPNSFAGLDNPAQGAAAIRLALLPPDGPAGTASSARGPRLW